MTVLPYVDGPPKVVGCQPSQPLACRAQDVRSTATRERRAFNARRPLQMGLVESSWHLWRSGESRTVRQWFSPHDSQRRPGVNLAEDLREVTVGPA